MALGPGKYDDICSTVRAMVGIPEGGKGGVILIVVGGSLGSGFSCQADMVTSMQLPDLLDQVVQQMRKDIKGGTDGNLS